MADALTGGSYRKVGEQAPGHARRVFTALRDVHGRSIGGHTDSNANDLNCGCGAEDKLDNLADPQLPSILGYLERRGGDVRDLLGQLGIDVDEDLHMSIIANARQLRVEQYAASGAAISKVISEVGGDIALETVYDAHNEVFLKIIKEPRKGLNRQKLVEKFGTTIQAFALNLPELQAGTALIAVDASDAHAKFIAALYYNLATAAVLAGPSLIIA